MSLCNPKNCLICQSKDYRVIFSYDKPDQYEIAIGVSKEGYDRKWVECKNCGLFYSIYSRKENMESIYKSSYRDSSSPWRKESPEELFKKVVELPEGESETKFRVKWIKENINKMWDDDLLKKAKSPHNFLDIGGGNGIFAYEFQDKEWKSHIVDPNENGKFIESTLKILFVQSYYKQKLFNVKFDLISLVFVLEHLNNPINLLTKVKEDMTNNSLLYIEVPDAICFSKKPEDDDIFNSCHLWMFSPNTLTLLLDRCGFEIFCLGRIKTKRDHYALMVLAGKK